MRAFFKRIVNFMERAITIFEKPRLNYFTITLIIILVGTSRTVSEKYLLNTNFDSTATWTHLVAFFLSYFMISGLILSYFSRSRFQNTLNAMLGLWWVTLLPPFVDHYIFGRNTPYLYEPAEKFLYNVSTLFWNSQGGGKAIVLEILTFVLMAGVFVFVKTRKPLRAVLAVISLYLLAAVSATPGVISFLDPRYLSMVFHGAEYGNKLLFLVYVVLTAVFLLAGIKKDTSCRLKDCFKALRFHSLITFSLMLVMGYVVGRYITMFEPGFEFFPIIMADSANLLRELIDLDLLLLAWIFGWQASVMINDIYDLEIDRISNPDRPLPRQLFSIALYKDLALLCITGALVMTVVFSRTIFLLMFSAVVVLNLAYSAPPFRLKRQLWGAPVLMGTGSGLVALMGYLAAGAKITPQIVPIGVVAALCFAFGINTKDIKDFEGDQVGGVNTFFTVYGYEKGKKMVSCLAFFSAFLPVILFPGLFQALIFFLFSLCIGMIFFKTGNMFTVFPVYFLEFGFVAFLIMNK